MSRCSPLIFRNPARRQLTRTPLLSPEGRRVGGREEGKGRGEGGQEGGKTRGGRVGTPGRGRPQKSTQEQIASFFILKVQGPYILILGQAHKKKKCSQIILISKNIVILESILKETKSTTFWKHSINSNWRIFLKIRDPCSSKFKIKIHKGSPELLHIQAVTESSVTVDWALDWEKEQRGRVSPLSGESWCGLSVREATAPKLHYLIWLTVLWLRECPFSGNTSEYFRIKGHSIATILKWFRKKKKQKTHHILRE